MSRKTIEEGTGGKGRLRPVCHLWSSWWERVSVISSRSDPERERKEGRRWVKKHDGGEDWLSVSTCRHSGLQRELVPHGDVSDRILHTHTGRKSLHLCVKRMCFTSACLICALLCSSGWHPIRDGGRLWLGWWSVEGRDQRTHHAAQRGFWKRVSTGTQKSCCLFRYAHHNTCGYCMVVR